MATEAQYLFFKSMYDEENSRYVQLDARAKFYLTIQTFYLGAIAFKFSDVEVWSKRFAVPIWSFVVIGMVLLAGVLLTLFSTRVRAFEAPADLLEIIESFGKKPPTDSDFLDDRLVDLAVATQRNCDVNERIAVLLTFSGWMLFAAVFIHFLTFVWAYLHPTS